MRPSSTRTSASRRFPPWATRPLRTSDLHSGTASSRGSMAWGMEMRERGASTSLRPLPVARMTARCPEGKALLEAWSLRRPARAAAPAGSVKMPVRFARVAWAARISSSVTVRVRPRALQDGPAGAVGVAGAGDGDGVGPGGGVGGVRVDAGLHEAVDGVGGVGLDADEAGEPLDEAGPLQVHEGLVHPAQDHPVPHGDEDGVGHRGSPPGPRSPGPRSSCPRW